VAPSINWINTSVLATTVEEERDLLNHFINEAEVVYINAKLSTSQQLAWKFEEDQSKKKLPKEELVPKEYHAFLHLFDRKTSECFPPSWPYNHKIELKEGFVPTSTKIYPLTQKEDEAAKKFVEDNLAKGYIRELESPMTSGFFFVRKKDITELRPCQDYKYLNNWTVKNGYPLPLVTDLLNKLKDAKYFTKLDIRAGYNNVWIRDGDQWKAAFKTKYGSYEPMVMFFSLCNSPATFQHMMDTIFRPFIDAGWLIDFIDNLLIFAKTKEELEEKIKLVQKKIEENDLYLKPEKAEFCTQHLEYLGMIIKPGQISMDPAKLDGIRSWPSPKTVKQLRLFLGFGNFYQIFIRKYSTITQPLNNLLKKNTLFNWIQECEDTFLGIKKVLHRRTGINDARSSSSIHSGS